MLNLRPTGNTLMDSILARLLTEKTPLAYPRSNVEEISSVLRTRVCSPGKTTLLNKRTKDTLLGKKAAKPGKRAHSRQTRTEKDDIADNNSAILIDNSTAMPFNFQWNLYKCLVCSMKFLQISELREHMEGHETGAVPVKKILRVKDGIIKVEVSDLRCKLCNERIKDLEGLKVHLVDKHEMDMDLSQEAKLMPFKLNDDNIFNCLLCSQKLQTFNRLSFHMNTHFYKFICSICGKVYRETKSLNYHVRSHFSGSYPCTVCKQVFDNVGRRDNHMKCHRSSVHKCPQCPETFKYYAQRIKHLLMVHNTDFRVTCEICGAKFYQNGRLIMHNREMHQGIRNHGCPQCNAAFFSAATLKLHLISHTGIKNFKCDVCLRMYSRRASLVEHMKIHDDVRKFVCGICGKTFIQKCSLKSHMKTHKIDYINYL